MLLWLLVLVLAMLSRLWAKTRERRAASALTVSIYRGVNEDAVKLMSGLIIRPTAANELTGQIMNSLPPFSLFFKFIYPVFAFTLATQDAKTPPAHALFNNEEAFYELHDPDVFELYRRWKAAFFWDGVSAGVLILVVASLFSKNIFQILYRW